MNQNPHHHMIKHSSYRASSSCSGNSLPVEKESSSLIRQAENHQRPSFLDRLVVSLYYFGKCTPMRQAIDKASLVPRLHWLLFCILWILVTATATTVIPTSLFLRGLWQASFVMPALTWIYVPLVVSVPTDRFFKDNF